MAAASTDRQENRSLTWCAERLLVPGNPLTLTRPYAAENLRDPLLALRAVIGEIARVPGEVSDGDVGRRKLGWWRQALTEHLPHPALQALTATGAARPRIVAELLGLVDAVETTLHAPRFETVDAFDAHARALAGPAARAEAGLVEDDELRQDVVEQPHRTRALMAWMAGQAVTTMVRAEASLAAQAAWRHRHAVLHATLDARLGRRIVRRPGRALEHRLDAVGPLTALTLWRRARAPRRRADRAD